MALVRLAPMDDNDYLSPDDVAELVKVHPATVRQWVPTGQLPAGRAGPRRVRIRRSDLDAFIASGAPSRAQEGKPLPTMDNAAIADALGAVAQALGQLSAALRSQTPTKKRATKKPTQRHSSSVVVHAASKTR